MLTVLVELTITLLDGKDVVLEVGGGGGGLMGRGTLSVGLAARAGKTLKAPTAPRRLFGDVLATLEEVFGLKIICWPEEESEEALGGTCVRLAETWSPPPTTVFACPELLASDLEMACESELRVACFSETDDGSSVVGAEDTRIVPVGITVSCTDEAAVTCRMGREKAGAITK